MPYQPYTSTEVDRSYAYKSAWISAACSVVTLPLYLLGYDGIVYGWIFGGAVGGVLASALTGRTDDYFRSLCAVGHRWVMLVLGTYMLAGWLVWTITDVLPPARGVLSETNVIRADAGVAMFFDAQLVAIVLVIVFHAGYGFQWLRDHMETQVEL